MKRFVQSDSRTQSFLLPEALDDYMTDTNPVRVVEVFVDELDLQTLGSQVSRVVVQIANATEKLARLCTNSTS